MKRITEFTEDYKQRYTLVTEDNKTFLMNFEFIQQQQSWFYSLTYGSYSLNGQRLVLGPNILHRYKNLFPFGILVNSTDGLAPFQLTDFTSGRIGFYLLTKTEVAQVETDFFDAS